MYIRYPGDLKPEDFSSPKKAKRNLDFLIQELNHSKQVIKKFKMRDDYSRKKINDFKTLLSRLKDENLINDVSKDIIAVICFKLFF